jgi:arylformamidase
MIIIDLSLPLTHKMPVYPGDPEVDITEIHTLENEGWNLRTLRLNTHIGTHVNVPYHMSKNGKTLEQYKLNDFIGESIVYSDQISWDKNIGLIFVHQNIDQKMYKKLISNPPKFIGLSSKFEFDVELEKKLLEKNIVSFENLANTEKLPERFTFYGIPLNIPKADGSPVRAFAVK